MADLLARRDFVNLILVNEGSKIECYSRFSLYPRDKYTKINRKKEQTMKYDVIRAEKNAQLDADWNGRFWNEVKPLELARFMGPKTEHQPHTQAKVAYDDRALYVIFRVEDRYVRAVAQKHQDQVCLDSCAEFFFTPGADASVGYFNMEVNCSGTLLLYHQTSPACIGQTVVSEADCNRIEMHAGLPKIIDPEIKDPVTWTVAYAIPLDVLKTYAPVAEPAPGVIWRANFYKCADRTSHPHWLTWAPVDLMQPNFHRPDFFGTLAFV
jgi:hypothetical protein